ncbi:hypothetical protein OIDMADRAFT_20369, partial [Oidiodendron maius Zn]
MANDAGTPISGMFRRVRLRPKSPLRRIPAINKLMPNVNWLSFPMRGTKGLPTALSQTWCSDDSISSKSDRKQYFSQLAVRDTVGFMMLCGYRA